MCLHEMRRRRDLRLLKNCGSVAEMQVKKGKVTHHRYCCPVRTGERQNVGTKLLLQRNSVLFQMCD